MTDNIEKIFAEVQKLPKKKRDALMESMKIFYEEEEMKKKNLERRMQEVLAALDQRHNTFCFSLPTNMKNRPIGDQEYEVIVEKLNHLENYKEINLIKIQLPEEKIPKCPIKTKPTKLQPNQIIDDYEPPSWIGEKIIGKPPRKIRDNEQINWVAFSDQGTPLLKKD